MVNVPGMPPLTFEQFVLRRFDNPLFLSNFNRLFGTELHFNHRPDIRRLAKEAIGTNVVRTPDTDAQRFFNYMFEYVWVPMQLQAQREGGNRRAVITPQTMLEPA